MHQSRKQLLITTAILASGTLFQVGGCNLLGSAGTLFGQFNPCQTILNCDPRAFNFITSGIDGPGLDVDADPFCTFPPFCPQAQDPIFGGLGGP